MVTDTEMFSPSPNALKVVEFNPGHAMLPRLTQYENMYSRYRILSLTIKFIPACATTTTGSLYMGIAPGSIMEQVKNPDTILKLRPSRCCAVWQTTSISVGENIDSQRFMHTGTKDNDSVAFALYYHFGNVEASGHFQVAYKIEFAYPKVF